EWTTARPGGLALVGGTGLARPAGVVREKAKFPPALATVTVIVGGFAVIGGVLWAIAPSVVDQVGDIAKDASRGLGKVEEWLIDGPFDVSEEQISTAIEAAQEKLTESASTIASGALTGVSAVTTFIVGAAIAYGL